MKRNTVFTIFIYLEYLYNLDDSLLANHELEDVSYIPLVNGVLQLDLVH